MQIILIHFVSFVFPSIIQYNEHNFYARSSLDLTSKLYTINCTLLRKTFPFELSHINSICNSRLLNTDCVRGLSYVCLKLRTIVENFFISREIRTCVAIDTNPFILFSTQSIYRYSEPLGVWGWSKIIPRGLTTPRQRPDHAQGKPIYKYPHRRDFFALHFPKYVCGMHIGTISGKMTHSTVPISLHHCICVSLLLSPVPYLLS